MTIHIIRQGIQHCALVCTTGGDRCCGGGHVAELKQRRVTLFSISISFIKFMIGVCSVRSRTEMTLTSCLNYTGRRWFGEED
jgi:hypothetical protein